MKIPGWSTLVDFGKEILQYRREVKQAKQNLKLAVINNKARLAENEQTHNSNWEMASLEDKDRFLRRTTFFLFTFPIVLVMVSPEHGQIVLQRLEIVPEWMLIIYMTMISVIWGASQLKDSIPQIVGGIRNVLGK